MYRCIGVCVCGRARTCVPRVCMCVCVCVRMCVAGRGGGVSVVGSSFVGHSGLRMLFASDPNRHHEDREP